ncbi:FAD-dependent monooxygenase [Azorhizobium doebereinerae]|uniref:FAD-dependent monooxygenase n=1 Tax=Azorhizobium doebereinerae TaxID=281091 RepID=UPI0004161214|nr:FAD-dependent monooxygenase [Azorhizobium doebereinerae]
MGGKAGGLTMAGTAPSGALIVGAGIGGLACGIALRRAGLKVRLLEQADALAEVGAGLQLTPNATRHLRDFGLLDALEQVAVAPRALEVRDGRSFALLAHCDYAPMAARLGAPFLVVHRADLLAVLAEGARAAGCEMRLGARLQSLEPHGAGMRAVAAEGDGLIAETADIVIGADGVRSVVREHLHLGARPVFARRVAYRATIPLRADTPKDVRLFLGPDAHLVTYPVKSGTAVNVVAIVKQDRPVSRWSEPGEASAVHAAFAGWAPEVRALLQDAPAFLCWGLYDVDPLPRWSEGPITLLGDAAHAMLPFLAQGAAQAIEDAAALAAAIARGGATPAALRSYEAARQPRTARIQRGARRNAGIYHMKGPARLARDAVMRATGAGLLERYDWIYAG